jgi:hypothetical protein
MQRTLENEGGKYKKKKNYSRSLKNEEKNKKRGVTNDSQI